MKFISWNVNGIRASIKDNFSEVFSQEDADFFLVQETRSTEKQANLKLPDEYYQFWNSAVRPGYSGTAIFTKNKPLKVTNGISGNNIDEGGRVITLEYKKFFLINAYVPNSGEKLQRLEHRIEWNEQFLKYVDGLKKKKPVIIGGDLNVAYQPIDIFDPEEAHHQAGYTEQERSDFGKLLDSGYLDTFRVLHPDTKDAYTWWSYREHARDDNHGWRLDYFLVSDSLKNNVDQSNILSNVLGSDHAPIQLITKNLK